MFCEDPDRIKLQVVVTPEAWRWQSLERAVRFSLRVAPDDMDFLREPVTTVC